MDVLDFLWSAAVTSFIIMMISSLFVLSKTKLAIYKYYIFYAVAAIITLVLEHNNLLNYLQDTFNLSLKNNYHENKMVIYILTYSIYGIFVIDFMELKEKNKNLFVFCERILFGLMIISLLLYLVYRLIGENFISIYYYYVWAPLAIIAGITTIIYSFKNKKTSKRIFLLGVTIFILLSLFTLLQDRLGTNIGFENLTGYYYIGLLIENQCLAIGVALLYRERISENQIQETKLMKLEQESKLNQLKGIIEGEKEERSTLANLMKNVVSSELTTSLTHLGKEFNENKSNHIKHSLVSTQTAINKIDKAVQSLSIEDLKRKGLTEAIHLFAAQQPISVDVENKLENISIGENSQFFVFRIIQELVENIELHSEATEAKIILSERDDQLKISVSDNGIGFQEEDQFYGVGLTTIEKRAELLNGYVSITSVPNNGTTIDVIIPLEELNKF